MKIDNQSVIYQSTVFDLLARLDRSFLDVLNDKRDYRALIRQSETKEERSTLSFERSAHRLVSGFNDELDIAFNALNLQEG